MIYRLTTILVVAALAGTGCGQRSQTQEHADRMAREHRDDAPVANPGSTTEPAAPVTAEEVHYATVGGEHVTGYLSRPEDAAGPRPGLIVIHEWWGLNDNIRSATRRLAGEGYAALAVDLYGGRTAEDPSAARELMVATNENPAAAEANLEQAYRYLKEEIGSPQVASIGWCFGGGWSLQTALMLPDQLDAAVIYYGRLVTDPERLAILEMPILGLFGGQDQGIPVDDVHTFQETLARLGKDAEIHIYPDANHAFANPSGRNYDPEAADAAWRETTQFLAEHLQR
jgi:carboxymethylenebutenolidase